MTDTVATPADLDAILASIFLTPEGKADPYPGYATVREATALHHSALGIGIATRYEDCQALLRRHQGQPQHQLRFHVYRAPIWLVLTHLLLTSRTRL